MTSKFSVWLNQWKIFEHNSLFDFSSMQGVRCFEKKTQRKMTMRTTLWYFYRYMSTAGKRSFSLPSVSHQLHQSHTTPTTKWKFERDFLHFSGGGSKIWVGACYVRIFEHQAPCRELKFSLPSWIDGKNHCSNFEVSAICKKVQFQRLILAWRRHAFQSTLQTRFHLGFQKEQ